MTPLNWVRLVTLAALWGSSYLFIRIAAPELGVWLTMGLRVMIAAITLVIYGVCKGVFPDVRSRWRAYLCLGLLNNAIPFTLIAIAVVSLNASIAAILNATTPLCTAILAILFLSQSLNWQKGGGLLLGILGVGILVGWNPLPLSPAVLAGICCALLAALSYGFAAVYARHAFTGSQPLDVATGQLLGSSLLLLPGSLLSVPEQFPSLSVLLAVSALAVFCTAGAYLLYFQLIATAGPTSATTVTFLMPFFSLALGFLLLSEPINLGLILGLTVILCSIRLVTSAPQGPAQ